MKRYRLTRAVSISGPDAFGRPSKLTLRPLLEGSGWHWQIAERLTVPITPKIMRATGRCVALVCPVATLTQEPLFDWAAHGLTEEELKTARFSEFEHVGALRAAGLDGVTISLEPGQKSTWPPYDGGAWQIWRAVKPHLEEDGELLPWAPADYMATHPEDAGRSAHYGHKFSDHLRLTAYLKYGDYPEHRCGFNYPHDDIGTLMKARTLGWPPALYYFSKVASPIAKAIGREWPHHERIVWPQETSPEEMNEETGRHRLLDALGVLAFVPPSGHYLTGTYHSCLGGHLLDVTLAQSLYRNKNIVPLKQKVA